jgi:hypothetical protein
MMVKSLLEPILLNENLTRRLGDAEARLLVEWLVDQAEMLAQQTLSEEQTRLAVGRLCRRGHSISRFVSLWCQERNEGAACQLAATERFAWPLPSGPMDPCDLMHDILTWEAGAR